MAAPDVRGHASSDAAPTEKLAERVARAIEADIIAKGWPVGRVLGSEADLLRNLGVSRATLREAVRLLEHKQVATMRRGPNGGLVVQAPAASSVAQVAAAYFEFADLTVHELYEASRSLSLLSIQLATQVLDEEGIALLRAHLRAEAESPIHPTTALPRFEVLIAELTGNPALSVFANALTRALWTRAQSRYIEEEPTSGRYLMSQVRHAHEAISDAIISGDAALAQHRMALHLDAFESWTRSEPVGGARTRQSPWGSAAMIAPPRDGKKMAERLAASIREQIRERHFRVGQMIGSESDFLAMFDVSRAVFREAVRILEHHGVAQMRRGPGGGLVVRAPDPSSAIEAMVSYLGYIDIDREHFYDLRAALELKCIELATIRTSETQRAALLHSAQEMSSNADLAEFHTALAVLADNRALQLFVTVLVALTEDDHGLGPDEAACCPAHSGIAAAMSDQDVGLASHRLRTHMRDLRAGTATTAPATLTSVSAR